MISLSDIKCMVLKVMINKNNGLINKLDRNWRHSLIRKDSHLPFNEY